MILKFPLTSGHPPVENLEKELAKFGPTLRDALRIKPSDVSHYINAFVVLNEFGDVESALGGIPLEVKLNITSNIPNDEIYTVRLSGRDCATWRHPIQGSTERPAGFILAFDDIGDQSKVLNIYKRFNLIIGAASRIVAVLGAIIFLVVDEARRRKQEVSLEDALKAGEGQTIEFKADILDHTLANTIAPFANTNSGSIFLDVNDNAEVVGLTAEPS